MRKNQLIAVVGELLTLADQLRVETPVTTYELTTTPAPPDEPIITNKKDQRSYSTNPRHAKVKKGKTR